MKTYLTSAAFVTLFIHSSSSYQLDKNVKEDSNGWLSSNGIVSTPNRVPPEMPSARASGHIPLVGRDGCSNSSFECGPYCCPASSSCTVDINANYACCPDKTFCTGSSTQTVASPTATQANIGAPRLSLGLLGPLTGLATKAYALLALPSSPTTSSKSSSRMMDSMTA